MVHLQIAVSVNNFSVIHSVLTGPGAYPASYSVGTGFLFLVLKRPGRESYHWPSSTVEFNIDTLLPSPQKDALMNYSGRDNAFFILYCGCAAHIGPRPIRFEVLVHTYDTRARAR